MSDRDRNQVQSDGTEPFDSTQSPTPLGNRPAAGAPQVDTTTDLDRGWQGNTGATDFLGLDNDLRVESASPSNPTNGLSGLSPNAEGPVLDSWLMEIEATNPAHSSATASAAHSSDDASHGDDFDPESDTEFAPAAPARPRRFAQAAALVAVLALAAAGTWYWQNQKRAHITRTAEVATRPDPKPTQKPKIPTPKPTNPTTAVTPPVVEPTATASTAPTTTPEPTATTTASTTPEVTPTSSTDFPPLDTTPTGTNPSVTVTLPDTSAALPAPTITLPPTLELPPAGGPTAKLPPPPIGTQTRGGLHVTVDPSGRTIPGSIRRATEDDFADLWRETRIPTELFDGERRLRTLNVGRVRALIVGGEYFDGTLYAVGQGRIWLDLELGRISFQATTVRELTQLAPLPVEAGAGKKKVDELAGLPRVEVRLPGGSITGRLIGQDGKRVTIVTDEGMRAVVDSDDIRPVTARNTRVVGLLRDLESQPR